MCKAISHQSTICILPHHISFCPVCLRLVCVYIRGVGK